MNDQNNLIDGLNTSQILVGLDLGTKTIGVAVSDRSKIIATPLSIIQRKGTDKDLIIMKDILNEYEIGGGNSNELIQKKAKIFENLSNAYSGNKEPKASISASKTSFDLLNSIYSINKNNNLGREAAKICITISEIYQSIGELENSKTYSDQALTILDEITKDSLLIERDQYLYATANLQLGLTLGLKEQYSQSREYLELAIAQFSELVTAIPENINYQFHVAQALGKVAEIEYNTGVEEAEAINNYSIELLNNLIIEKPKDAFKHELSKRYYSVAIALNLSLIHI